MSTLNFGKIKATTKRISRQFRALLYLVAGVLLVIAMSGVTDMVNIIREDGVGSSTSAAHQPTAKELEQKRQDGLKLLADGSSLGKQLISQGYTGGRTIVTSQGVLDFLNKQLHTPNAKNYVEFTKNPSSELPDDYVDNDPPNQAAPDVIYNADTGVLVALSKNYKNGRGLTCMFEDDPRDMVGTFNKISAAVWNKSLDEDYFHKDVPAIPADAKCHTQSS